jgi:sigma-B regulation protein RsbU (phosphoserine phosphatase)
MPRVNSDALRDLPFLRDVSGDVLRTLARVARQREYQPGDVILQEGTLGREWFVIQSGLVEIVRGEGSDAVALAERGPGEFFGEMALLEARSRFATVRAVRPTRLIEFSGEDLYAVLAEQPLLLFETARVLMARLRESDLRMIGDLQRKNRELAQAYRQLQDAQAALLEKERLERELQLARDLQQSILPQTFPPVTGLQFGANNRPARQVGGDFYDVIQLGQGRVGLVMADVSDKGMPAALYMALTRSLIHAEAKRRRSPRRVLRTVHRLLREISQAEMFVTAFYGVLEAGRHTLRYARAGHDWPLLVSPSTGACQELAAPGMMLGILEDIRLEEGTVELQPGDILVLYTDGITDAQSPDGKFFGPARLRDTVCEGGALGAQDLCDAIFRSVDAFQQGTPQHDDMAVMAVKRVSA